MPFDPRIKKVLVIGAGPIVIGQGCEFDYSGTQACKALKEEGCQVVLINSNPATIMTDPQMADAVYIEPINLEILEKIIQQERPDSLLPTMGGQTALNCTIELAQQGILKRYGINLIGLSLETIEKAENRKLFRNEMLQIGLEVPRSFCISRGEELPLEQFAFPVIVRCSFTLGGQGGGIAHNRQELEKICQAGFAFSEELMIEESIAGWKEYELEVLRDRKGNCIVVCGIENIDPMGVHTGDSITVAPIQTLTDKEYQLMRKRAFQIMEAIGMVSGGCNVQFAIHPQTGQMLCIEVNPRVSRSSAFASKATGFPIAKIATKIALGYHLDELKNEAILSSFPSSFEPVIDYVAIKIPRFNFEKFSDPDLTLSTHMKSVGEVMALGRTFKEALNKALASLETNMRDNEPQQLDVWEKLKTPHPRRLYWVFEAFHQELSIEEVHALTKYDFWFLAQINDLVKEEKKISSCTFTTLNADEILHWKQMGFTDEKLALLLNCREEQILDRRKALAAYPVYKRVDTCSGEFPNEMAYLYSTYEEECESDPTTRKKVLVLGSGPNRIGQGIEFDYCCTQAVKAIRELGYESILINCNPSTVSTDYDTTDRLYFEPLTLEHVREVIRKEKPLGTIIQFGGQTPLNIAKYLHKEDFPLLGTAFASIDLVEDREKFRIFAENIGIKQPLNGSFSTSEEAWQIASIIGFPMILRPSYVIGGNAIQIIQNERELNIYLNEMPLETISPILMEQFLQKALEVEVDAICDGKDVLICGVIEHIEPAGIHSGDSMSFLSPYLLNEQLQKKLIEQTNRIGQALKIIGLFNVQFAIYKNEIFILEVNVRASRTIPLLSKMTEQPFVKIAIKCLLGHTLMEQGLGGQPRSKLLGLKLPVFPFERLNLKKEKLGPQMKSTGEVLCTGKTYDELFLKARLYRAKDKNLFTNDLESKLPCPNPSTILEVYAINDISDTAAEEKFLESHD